MFERNPDKSIDVTADGAVALVDDFATAGEQEEISTPPMSDKRGYVKSSEGVGDCHPERAKRVEGSRAAPAGTAYGSEPMAASDVAFLAPDLVSEAEGPVPVPAPAEGRLGYRFVKRAFDIAFSLCAIAVLLVPSIVLCVAIRLESPGCPIYSQKRVGRIGRGGEARTFDMYKFRSMHKDADERLAELAELNEADGPLFKIKDDPRVASRIIDATARRSSFGPAVASVFPPKMTVISAVFSQVTLSVSNLRNLLKNSFQNLLSQIPATTNFFAEHKSAPISWGGGLSKASLSCRSTL